MQKLLLIINPVAGKLNVKAELFSIIDVFCKSGYRVTTQITQFPGEGIRLASSACKENFNLIVCCGGDGTLNEVVTGILQSEHQIPLGYIPFGSTNDFARTLKIPSSPIRASESIVKGNKMKVDAGCFNNSKYFTYIASFGAFSEVSYTASQEAKNRLGHFAYLAEALRTIPHIQPHFVSITADGVKTEGDFVFGAITNTTSVAGIVKIKSSIVDLQDGLFETILVKTPKNPIELNKILAGITNSHFDNDMFVFFKAKDIELHMPDNVFWTLDGEKAEGGEFVHIHNMPNALTMYY